MRRLLAFISIALAVGVSAASAAGASTISLIAPWGTNVFANNTVTLTYSVSASKGVSDEAVDAAKHAASTWAAWLSRENSHFVVSEATGMVNVPIKIQSGSGPTAGVTKLSFDRQGFIKGATVSIRISNSPVWVSGDVGDVTLHELGHAFVGLGHSDLDTDLMWPYVNGVSTIGKCERNGFDALYGDWLGSAAPQLPSTNAVGC